MSAERISDPITQGSDPQKPWQRAPKLLSQPDVLHQSGQDALGREVFSRNLPRSLDVRVGVGVDLGKRIEDLTHRPKGEETPSGRQDVAERRVWADHRATRSKITGAQFAEPAAAQAN